MPTFANTSSTTVRIIPETVFGQTPLVGNPETLRVTGESLKYDISKEKSQEINATRTAGSAVPVDASVSGGLEAEVHFGGFDKLIASTFMSSWAAFGTNGVGAAVTVDATATTLTAAVAPTGANAFTNLKPGQWFRVASAGANAGKILRVSAVTAPTTTVITLDSNTPAAVSSAESIQIQSSRLRNGNVMSHYSIERENADVGEFTLYRGCTPASMQMEIASGSLSSMSFEFVGKDSLPSATTQLPGTPTPAVAYDIHSGVAGATLAIWMDGVPLTSTFASDISLSYDNGLRAQGAVGYLGAVGIGTSMIECEVSMTVYFTDQALYSKFIANQNISLIFSTTDAAGNGYIFTLPKVNIMDHSSNAGDNQSDQMIELTLGGLDDRGNVNPDLRYMVYVDRIGDALAA
jgi:hypothetical protein